MDNVLTKRSVHICEHESEQFLSLIYVRSYITIIDFQLDVNLICARRFHKIFIHPNI